MDTSCTGPFDFAQGRLFGAKTRLRMTTLDGGGIAAVQAIRGWRIKAGNRAARDLHAACFWLLYNPR